MKYEDIITRLQDRISLLRDLYNRALSLPHMTEDDILVARQAIESLDYGERLFIQFSDKLRSQNAPLAGDIVYAVEFLLDGTLMAASRVTLSKSAFRAAHFKHTQVMRDKKADPEKEQQLLDIITTALAGRDPRQRGMSTLILGQVNRALKDRGYAEVNRFVVARRLKDVRS